ncbi:MAG: DUF935 domain-containing protein [Sphingomonadaceae bacterium]
MIERLKGALVAARAVLSPGARGAVAAQLRAQVAAPSLGSTRSILSGHPADNLGPERLAALLRGAEDGDATAYLELAEQMEERDLHYLSVLSTRKRQVSQLPVTIEAASDAADHQRHAELLREWLARDRLEAELFDILDAIGKGYSVTEIVWDTSGGRWLPAELRWRDPRWFEFDRIDGETVLLRGAPSGGVTAPAAGIDRTPLSAFPYKFITHVHPAKSGLPIRGGFARAVAWAYLFKSYGLKDWVSFCEIYGLPFRIGRYEAGASEEDIRQLMRAVANIGSDAAAVMPKSMEVEFQDGKTNGAADVYDRLCQYLDRQVSKAVLGQTATTDADTGGLGSGKEHGEVRQDIERADAKLLSATLQRQLVEPIVDLNFGHQALYPKIRIGREESHDITAMSGALARLVPLGLRVSESVVRDRLGFPDPAPDETILSRPEKPAQERAATRDPANPRLPPQIAPGGLLRPSHFDPAGRGAIAEAVAAAVSQAIGADEDEIDAAGRHLATTEGQALLAPLCEPMLDALAATGSFEEAAAALDRAIAGMDTAAFEAAVRRACLTARIAGTAGA